MLELPSRTCLKIAAKRFHVQVECSKSFTCQRALISFFFVEEHGAFSRRTCTPSIFLEEQGALVQRKEARRTEPMNICFRMGSCLVWRVELAGSAFLALPLLAEEDSDLKRQG